MTAGGDTFSQSCQLVLEYSVSILLIQSAENNGKQCHRLVTLTSPRDSELEHSNITFNENKLDGLDLSSNGPDHCV